MSYGGGSIGPPPSMILIFAGAACIITGPMLSLVLGISEAIPMLLGVAIMIIGAPITLHMSRNTYGAMPPCFLFVFSGFLIVFSGFWVSFPWRNVNLLGATLVILGILQAVLGGGVGTLYIRRVRGQPAKPLWRGRSQFKREPSYYDYKPKKERIVEREILLRQRIPLECDNCGAPISSEEVDWIGPDTIKCPNCGHSLRVETERI